LAEIDAYTTFGIESGSFDFAMRPPGIARPRTVAELAPGYERVHAEARARLEKLRTEDLDRSLPYFDKQQRSVSDSLWDGLLLHLVHHRGQLALLCRLAGGVCPGMFGPNREEMAALRATAG